MVRCQCFLQPQHSQKVKIPGRQIKSHPVQSELLLWEVLLESCLVYHCLGHVSDLLFPLEDLLFEATVRQSTVEQFHRSKIFFLKCTKDEMG